MDGNICLQPACYKNEHVIIHIELCTSYRGSILLLMHDSFNYVNHMWKYVIFKVKKRKKKKKILQKQFTHFGGFECEN